MKRKIILGTSDAWSMSHVILKIVGFQMQAIYSHCAKVKKYNEAKQVCNFLTCSATGQLISKGPFDVIVSSKKPMIFLRISALAYKKVSDQKI